MSTKEVDEMSPEELEEAKREIDKEAQALADGLSRVDIDLKQLCSPDINSAEEEEGTMSDKDSKTPETLLVKNLKALGMDIKSLAEISNKAREAGERAWKRGLTETLRDLSKMDAHGKLAYFKNVVLPNLREAFERGDKEYTGAQHFATDDHLERTAAEDIFHVEYVHVSVRLREAHDLATTGDLNGALEKIVSAIGYLVILHIRINRKLLVQDEDE